MQEYGEVSVVLVNKIRGLLVIIKNFGQESARIEAKDD
jgi:hypothetical protein